MEGMRKKSHSGPPYIKQSYISLTLVAGHFALSFQQFIASLAHILILSKHKLSVCTSAHAVQPHRSPLRHTAYKYCVFPQWNRNAVFLR